MELDRYEIMSKLGAGGYGEVLKARHRSTDTLMAMKFLPMHNRKKQEDALKEINNILYLQEHENIVKCYEWFIDESQGRLRYAIAMQLCDTDLSGFIKVNKNRDAHLCLDIATQTTSGIVFLHTHLPPIIHRDIKPQNVLLKQNDRTGKYIVKISDFGISNFVRSGSYDEEWTSDEVEQAFHSMCTTVGGRGTRLFMSPEFFAAKDVKGRKFRVDASVDVFALGVVFAYMFCYNAGNPFGQ